MTVISVEQDDSKPRRWMVTVRYGTFLRVVARDLSADQAAVAKAAAKYGVQAGLEIARAAMWVATVDVSYDGA